jgi:leucyl aminopeptidase (aminopeptidase T)
VTFANAVNVDYGKIKQTGSTILERLHKKEARHLEDCFSTGKECKAGIPAGEVYVAPMENLAYGTLVTHEVRDFPVQIIAMVYLICCSPMMRLIPSSLVDHSSNE